MKRVHTLALAGVLALALAGLPANTAQGNDTSVELSVGGLVFMKNEHVSIESEHLAITPETVTVRYQFLNRSAGPVTLTVAFPLPDINLAEAENFAFPHNDPVNFVRFRTTVDGKPITFTMDQRAFLGDKDVTDAVRQAKLRFLPLGDYQQRIAALAPAVRAQLVEQGLLVEAGQDQNGKPIFDPAWTAKTSAVRQQTFPAGRPVSVEHRYATSTGVSLDTVLRKALRENKDFEAEWQRYQSDYCVDSLFLRGIDRLAGDNVENVAQLSERRISYVLKTGANWAGPIKDFTLVVDKGKASRLVSFCLQNVRRVSSTVFEVKIKDFTPEKDLKLLFIQPGG